ncbi:MAG: transposase [Anaerolineae bacterium]|nr:transposase [Anaerolineae bacterium]
MKTLSYGQGSFVQCKAEELTLRLSARLFDAGLWATIQAWFQTDVRASHWLSAPFRVMTAEEDVPGYPRWKQFGVDVLSWVIFHLLVPPDHILVRLWQIIDWAGINRLCAHIYKNSKSGQRAWAPAQLFALLILFFVLPVPSECALLRLVPIVPLYRWFCGLGLFSILPDHSTLYDFRKNVGVELFEAILTWVVLRCLKAGLIANELAHFDMMGVEASARAWTPHERAVLLTLALTRYLELAHKGKAPDVPLPEALRQLAAEIAIEVLGNKRLKKDPKAPSRVLKSLERWTQLQQEAKGQALWDMSLEEAVKTLLGEEAEGEKEKEPSSSPQEPEAQRRWLKGIAQRLKDLLPHAKGDLDARVGWVSRVSLLCGYWVGFLSDGLHGVITAVRVTPLNIVQHTQMIPALDAHKERVGDYPEEVAADSAQDYYPVHQDLDERQIKGHIAGRNHRGVGGGLSSDYFTWDEEGQLHCPAGKVMKPGKPAKDGRTPFKAKASDCASCSRKAKCLPKGQQPDGPRRIQLEPAAHQRWLQNREHTHTDEYKEAQKKRFASEGLFGLAVRLHGADKMPYRSDPMNQIAGLMMGITMNLALLARHGASA